MTPAKRVLSATTVDVERRAEETANVPKQESSALFCVTVKRVHQQRWSVSYAMLQIRTSVTDDLKDILFTDLN